MNAQHDDRLRALIRLSAAFLALLALALPASAQTDTGGIAGATVSSIDIGDGPSVAIAASMGYRFNPTIALGVELTMVPSAGSREFELPIPLSIPGLIFPPRPLFRQSVERHATIFTGNLQLRIPTRSPRISPYLVGGAGVASIRDRIDYDFDGLPIILASNPFLFDATGIQSGISESFRLDTTDVALTIGGGVSFMMGTQWSIDGDARYLVVTGRRDIQTGRFGGGTTFRF